MRVENSFVLRVAGLPAESLRRLRFNSFDLADHLARSRAWLRTEGAALADSLHAVIGNAQTLKPALVGLRRALHRGRPPAAREWNTETAASVPPDIADRIRAWIEELRACQRMAAELPDALTAEWAAKEAVLKDIAAHPHFRRALAYASPALSAELTKWLEGSTRTAELSTAPSEAFPHPTSTPVDSKPGAEPKRLQRQSLIRLAKYVARATAKTSPLSTFTLSGLGTWSTEATKAPNEVVGIAELDGVLLQLIKRALRDNPELTRSLPLRVNPSVSVHGDRITFVGPSAREPVVTIPAAPAVMECLRIAEGRTLPEIEAELGDDPRVTTFVAGLVTAGLLERQIPVADLAQDPLGELADWLEGTDIAEAATNVRKLLNEPVPVTDIEGDRVRLSELQQAIATLSERVGIGSPGNRKKYQFRDNAVILGTTRITAPPALSDLDVVRRWMGAYDLALPLRLTLGTYCAERFGPGSEVPLLVLHRAIAEERGNRDRTPAAAEIAKMADNALVMPPGELAASALPRLRQLSRIRLQAGELMRGEESDGVVHIDAHKVEEAVGAWPDWVRPPGSIGCYVQAVPGKLVINLTHTGYGRGRARVSQLVGRPTEVWPETEPLLVEVRGAFANSANRQPPSLPYEIDYPYVVSDRPAAERIRLGDLVVVHDPETELVRLVWKRKGVEIRPVHLGMSADVLLPPAARLITYTFGAAHYLHTAALPILTYGATLARPQPVVRIPRVEVGRVVLQRARWVVRIEEIPVRAKGETDAEHWVRLIGWTRQNDVPTRCFVHMWNGDGAKPGDPFAWGFEKSRKPVYVDFANPYLVAVFERMLVRAGNVVIFDEALPDPDTVDEHVTEYLVEVSDA